jgi:hypothetical protein
MVIRVLCSFRDEYMLKRYGLFIWIPNNISYIMSESMLSFSRLNIIKRKVMVAFWKKIYRNVSVMEKYLVKFSNVRCNNEEK